MIKNISFSLFFFILIFQPIRLSAEIIDSTSNNNSGFLWNVKGIDISVGLNLLKNENKDYDELLHSLNFLSNLPKIDYGLSIKLGTYNNNISMSILYDYYFSKDVTDENNYSHSLSKSIFSLSIGYLFNVKSGLFLNPYIGFGFSSSDFTIKRTDKGNLDIHDMFSSLANVEKFEGGSIGYIIGCYAGYDFKQNFFESGGMNHLSVFSISINFMYNSQVYSKWEVGKIKVDGLPNYLIKGYSIGLNLHGRILDY
ncbi:MAG: hypothetical protein EPN82_08605 [Bacteroidetes bacterium]|nr:MAG: hypothetical protein EPN82_08605 [Bacteroidota bacterium]